MNPDYLIAAAIGLGALFIGLQIGLLRESLHSLQVMLNHHFQDLLRDE